METNDIVVFTGCSPEQQRFGEYSDHSILKISCEYQVTEVEVHSYHTRVKLSGIDGWFNSVCFDSKEK